MSDLRLLLELLRVRCPISTGVVKLVWSRSGLLEAAVRESFPYNKASAEESKASGGKKTEKKESKQGVLILVILFEPWDPTMTEAEIFPCIFGL